MKKLLLLCGRVFLIALTWQIPSRVHSDAIAMAVGVLFGMLAGIPVSLLVLASQRRSEPRDMYAPGQRYDGPPHRQPPVVVLMSGAQQQQQPAGRNWHEVPRYQSPQLAQRFQSEIVETEEW